MIPYSRRLVQSRQRLSCRTALNNVEIHVQHDLGLNPQPLLSLSAELYPQSSYLYPHLPLPPATYSIFDPHHFASSHYHVW
ncbi:hypothetical protein P692DRAFT_20134240 [Suillus brevipes Sb2]|nr:hypothetical protein P692DRAFT_20134240 [Suillus brevipes Sb2]